MQPDRLLPDVALAGFIPQLLSAVARSAIRRFLEARGCRTVAFAAGFRVTERTDADELQSPSKSA